MNFMLILFSLGLVCISAVLLTACLRRYAITHALLDLPNVRSSHTKAIPKGGGLAIVVTFLLAMFFLSIFGVLRWNVFIVLFLGGLIVGLIGWWDNYGRVAVSIRLVAHFLAAGWAIYWLGGISPLNICGVNLGLGWFGYILGLLFLVWLINLYNFMDGIDGLAGAEAVFVAVFAGILLSLGHNLDLVWALWVLAASTAGFLVWNWPSARIFMGDVGSGFLGFVLGVFILASHREGVLSIWPWFILLGIFLTDTFITLVRRVVRGSPWYKAHRRHAYQHAARRWGHLRVTLGVTFLNLFWLAPLAWIAWRYPTAGFGVMLLALIPLVFGAFYLKAGEETA